MEEKLKQLNETGSAKNIKIAIFGPESTGKTTLAIQLADHYKTVWTPEFARNYLQKKWDNSNATCTLSDMLPIAYGQTKLENDNVLIANKYLFCDTNLMVTMVFSELYYGFCEPELKKAAVEHYYDLYFLTDIDIPWEKDDLRDGFEKRATFFNAFEKALISNNKPYIKISGSKAERFQKAIEILENLNQFLDSGFTSQDFVQCYNRGTSIENIQQQLQALTEGIEKTVLLKPAKLEDGIVSISKEEALKHASFYTSILNTMTPVNFVPASGAASRMFKFLNEFLLDYQPQNERINGYINRKKNIDLMIFLAGIEKFPFYKEVKAHNKENYLEYHNWSKSAKNYFFIKTLLNDPKFDFANKPKGILPFHKYKNHNATPIEEHLLECANYSNSNNNGHLHFTVSQNHQTLFQEVLNTIQHKVEQKTGVKITVDFSFQDQSTDSIAVSSDNIPLRDANTNLIFRPGGHGALILNLNKLDGDLIFIKNIDNVIQNHTEEISLYKKALAGVLLKLQQKVFQFLKELEDNSFSVGNRESIVQFLKTKLFITLDDSFKTQEIATQKSILFDLLNRPIRVCGMVKNEGEPGGGPFWVKDSNGIITLQIVEASQIDGRDPVQTKILSNASHFNPVDLVCGIKNYKGNKFDLREFVDPKSGFIVEKSNKGISMKNYELPGLWNGGMSKWTTIFVEVPLLTFNPVKTVNDLLNPTHQQQ
jgi:nicotinamide riboside kinase